MIEVIILITTIYAKKKNRNKTIKWHKIKGLKLSYKKVKPKPMYWNVLFLEIYFSILKMYKWCWNVLLGSC